MAPSSSKSGMCCGMGCDEVFAYQTQKIVAIKDRRLGILKLGFMAVIIGYIIVYKQICQCRYMLLEPPVGTVRFSLREPTQNFCDPVKNDPCPMNTNASDGGIISVSQLPYCLQNRSHNDNGFQLYNCTNWDAIETKNIQDKSLLITTHVQEVNQSRDSCAEDTTTCKAGAPPQHLWHNTVVPQDEYIANIEKFTLLIDHSVHTPSIGVGAASRNMTGKLYVDNDDMLCATRGGVDANNRPQPTAPCYIIPRQSKGLDFFTLKTLMDAGGVDLEALAVTSTIHNKNGTKSHESQSYRFEGCVVLLEITYSNWEPWVGPWDWSDFPKLTKRAITYTYTMSLIDSSSYKYESVVYDAEWSRLVKTKNGMRISVLQTGQLGKFDFQTLLVQLTASLGLLAVSTTIVDLVATKLLKDKETYKKSKYEESKVIYGNEEFVNIKGPIGVYENENDEPLLQHSVVN
jgi:hypothetical protein